MEINRREFIVVPAAAMAGSLFAAASDDVPWQRKIRRLGQLNMTEHDPVVLNVEEWADWGAARDLEEAGAGCPFYEVLCDEQTRLYTRLFRS